MTQDAVNTAFTGWLAEAGVTGGCGAVLTRIPENPTAPLFCGGSTTVTWTVASDCEDNVVKSATFTIPSAPAVNLTVPGNYTGTTCMTQGEINTAFTNWLNGATVNGGCGTVLTNNGATAPSACGGSVQVTWTATSNCQSDLTLTRTFTIPDAPTVSLTVPDNFNGTTCMTQGDVNTAFTNWLNGATANGGCGTVLTNNGATAPSACGGSVQVTWTATSSCQSDLTQTRTFTIPDAPVATLTVPDNFNGTTCMTQGDVNTAFTNWLNGATVNGGCGTVLTNNGTTAPSACGGSVQVTWTATSSCQSNLAQTRTFTIPASPQISVTGPADITYSACELDGSADLNAKFSAWKAQFSVTEFGCGGQSPNISATNPPSLCGGGAVTINYTFTDGCKSATHTATFSVSPCYITVKAGVWNDNSVWKNGCRPPTAQGLPNYAKIYIDHDLTLHGDFTPSQGTNFLDVYVRDGATWHITGELHSLRNLSVYIEDFSTIQVGNEPPDCYTDFCEPVPPGCAYKKSLFRVDGSAQGSTDDPPGIYISEGGTFHLYGDMVVNQNYDIVVAPGGHFVIEGFFTAGNNAEVGFYGEGESGSTGYIGCDMIFTNSGKIYMDGADLDVGGKLYFGNSSDIYISNSTLSVLGEICSGAGIGSGAIITIHNGYFNENGDWVSAGDDDTSQINAGHFCASVFNPDGVPLPIELLSFTSEVLTDHVILHWVTAVEINNDYFTIERSVDLDDWNVLGHLAGAGTTNHTREYQFADMTPVNGLSYYRLKQTDFDGQFEYFDPIAVNFGNITKELEFNLTKTSESWHLTLPGYDVFNVEIYDLSGRRIYTGRGINNLTLPAQSHAVIMRVFSGTTSIVSRIIM
jgi:hypothetical protein